MRKFLILFILVYVSTLFSQDYQIIEDLAKVPILTPTFAERQTLKIKLNNELEAYLVSDPNGDQSSAALIVKSGSWNDPKAYPGIAHFLEHMLFLGTKKYPNESEFEGYIAEHGGQTNAFTSADFTAYVFSVNSNAFPEAFDRFSQFFIDPLFNPSGVAREIQAIDQEYAKNLENDDIREYHVYKELNNPEHPNHMFGMGNKDSLSQVSQDTLKQWYKENYSANRMRLVVHSTLPLEKLINLVVEDFREVPNQHLPEQAIDVEMIPESVKGHVVYIEPLTHMRRISLIWSLPAKFGAMQDTKPELLMCKALDNQGKGSLLSELKRERLAEEIRCSGMKLGNSFEFAIEVGLTDGGVKEVDKVILKCFQAIAYFKKKGIPQYLFDELHRITTLSYQYQERDDAFENILKEAEWIAEEDLSTYPERSKIIQKFDPKAVNELLSYLKPETAIYSLIAPSTLTKVPFDRKEQWLNVPYSVKAIPAELMRSWNGASPTSNFELPALNPFIPEKLNVHSQRNFKASVDQIPHPEVLFDNESAKIYFSKDQRYLVPKVSWNFQFKTPAIDIARPESIVLGDLYVKYMTDTLSEFHFSAALAGLDFTIERKNNGISLLIEGYSDKASRLCLEITKAFKETKLRELKFKIFKTSLLRQYQNTGLENPLLQAFDLFKSVIYQEYTTDKAKTLAIRKITFDQFEQFSFSLMDSIYLEGMFYGNTTKQEAKELIQQMISMLNAKPYLKKDQLKEGMIVLPANSGPYYFESKSKSQGNAVVLSIEFLPFNVQTRAAQQVLMQSMKDPFFADLRTKQQTGYVVLTQADEFEMHLFSTFLVQSNTHDGRDLMARFELFIEGFLQEIETMVSEQRFNNIKESFIQKLRHPPKNISEMGNLLNKLAFKYEGDFNWIDKRIRGFENLNYSDFIYLSKKMMGKENKRRLAILLKGTLSDELTMQYHKVCNIQQLRKLGTYEPGKVP